MKTLEAF